MESVNIYGTTNQVSTTTDGSNGVVISLPSAVTAPGDLTVTDDLSITNGNLTLANGSLSIQGGGANIIGSAINLTGTVTVSGTLLANSATMKFQDSLLEIGYINGSAVDHGFFSKHSDGDYVGVVYDQSASEVITFKTGTKPTDTVDTSAGDFEYADLRAESVRAEGNLLAKSALIADAGIG